MFIAKSEVVGELKTSCEWLNSMTVDVVILDFDGWDRTNLQESFYREKITAEEFNKRLSISTVCIARKPRID